MSDIELTAEAFAQLKKENSKLKLEANLRRSLSTQLEKQKKIADEAKQEAQEKTAELEVLSSKLSRYLSPQIYEQIFSGNQDANVTSQRKKLTVFFSDIVGFTDITEHLESEELTSLINFYLTEMSTIALKYGGTIDKYIGDAILIFFGDPESKGYAEDATSCLKMEIEMQQKMQELTNFWGKNFSLKSALSIRIGINTGFCTVGNFGSENRLDYTVIGSPVNLASRLESSAQPNKIIVSEETYLLVRDLFALEEVGEIKLKGISRPVKYYEVISEQIEESERLIIDTSHLKIELNQTSFGKEDLLNLENVYLKMKHMMNEIQNATDK